jgi:sulfur-oxidizing protein SoxY
MKSKIIALLISMLTAFPALADTLAKDPLDSVQWDDMYDAFLKGRPAQFDNRVKVIAPNYAEDPMNVPVTVDASELGDVTKIVIFAAFTPNEQSLQFLSVSRSNNHHPFELRY